MKEDLIRQLELRCQRFAEERRTLEAQLSELIGKGDLVKQDKIQIRIDVVASKQVRLRDRLRKLGWKEDQPSSSQMTL